MNFELSPLRFELDALEPFISRMTMEYHHGKHYQSYVTNLNYLVTDTRFNNLDLDTIVKIAEGPLFNNASQVWNHKFYFDGLRPFKDEGPDGSFADILIENFGSISFFKETFIKSSVTLFGSGWTWLVMNHRRSLEIIQKGNSGNPLRLGLIPLLTCDVWEHAYYLDYQNRRDEYLESFWKIINWDEVAKRYFEANEIHNDVLF